MRIDVLDATLDIFNVVPGLKTTSLKDYSSKDIWACVFYLHPRSLYSQLDFTDKVEFISTDLGIKFDPTISPYVDVLEYIEHFVLTKPQKYLVQWEKKLEERTQFMASIPYNADTFELLDKMMAASSRMWDQYMKCLKDVQVEEGRTQGDSEESLQEKNLI